MRGELPLLFSPRKHCAPPTSPLMSPKQRMTPSQRIPKKSKNPTKPGISSSTRLDDNADTDDLDDQLEKLTAQLSSLAVQQIEAPQPNQEASQEEEIVLDVLTLEQYEAAVAAGGVKPYRGKGGTAREMYDAGKAFNARTKRWVKAEKAKAEGEQRAVRSELARLRQEMERMVAHQRRTQELLALQRAVDAKKAEKLRRQEAALRAAAAAAGAGAAGAAGAGAAAAAAAARGREEGDLAPVLWVFDTNVWVEDAATGDVRYAANVVLSARPDVQLLLPREVLRELDGLKKGGPGRGDERTAFQAREGSRLVEELLTDPRGLGAGRRYPLLRGQRDGELWRDPQGGIHGRPERLRADAAVLNCCLHFARARRRRVVLLSRDRNLRQVARVNGVEAADPCPQRGANLYALGRDKKEAGGGDRRDGGAGQWGGGGVWEEPLSSGGERSEGLLGSRPMQYGPAR